MSTDTEQQTNQKPGPAPKIKTPGQIADPATAISILNPAWAEEQAKLRGLTGAHAKAAAADITRAVTKQLSKAVDMKKIDKIVAKSYTAHVGMTRGA